MAEIGGLQRLAVRQEGMLRGKPPPRPWGPSAAELAPSAPAPPPTPSPGTGRVLEALTSPRL